MYVRTKKVKGREYYYLVRSVRHGNQVRQENLEYLGPKMPTKKQLEAVKRRHGRRLKKL